ncbi:MAG: GNAT family N-acetyltransferase [Nostoc sp.]|uniref:GNAT family N-acetyltransferase n=1 Tax=Nostoc sp. TaxID=1180 RepID=UPI002FF56A06
MLSASLGDFLYIHDLDKLKYNNLYRLIEKNNKYLMIVKKLTRYDAEDYRQIRLEALDKNPDLFGTTYQEEAIKTIEQFRARIPVDNNNFILGCFEDKNLIGIVAFQQESRIKLRHKAYISSMYVQQEYRGKGIGKLLLNELIERAKTIKDIEILLLDIVKSNFLAKPLYLSLGFQIYGTEKRAYKYNNQYFDLEFMCLHIK